MGVTEEEVMESLKKYFSDHGFGKNTLELNCPSIFSRVKQFFSGKRKGKIIVGEKDNPTQTIDFIAKRNRLTHDWDVEMEGQYLEDRFLEFIEEGENKDRKVVYYPKTHSGFFGGKSPNLKRVYKILPSLKYLVMAEFLFGAQNALMETSTNAKLFINLKEIGILSVMTDVALTTPGSWAGERRGSWLVNDSIAPHTPGSKIKMYYDEHCDFITKKPWLARVSLEDFLRKKYFKDDEEFEERYLLKVNDINDFMKKERPNFVKEIANMIFDDDPPKPEDDQNLYAHLSNQLLIRVEDFEPKLRRFFDLISEEGLWTRDKFIDFYDCLRSVVKHGYYEEISDEQRFLKEGRKAIKQLKEGKELKKDDWLDLENVIKSYKSFLLTGRSNGHEAKDSKSMALVESLLKELENDEPKVAYKTLEEVMNYTNSRMSALSKADVEEVRVYSSLNDARKKFLDEPMLQYKREPNAEEMKIINDLCFGNINRARVGELASTTALAGMVGISHFIDHIPGGWLANALGWGLPIGLKSLYESYCHAKSERLMEYYLLVKYRKALEKESVDPEAAFSELGSVLRRVYLAGYMAGTAVGLPFLYATTPEKPWPIYISMATSAVLLGAANKTWLVFEDKAMVEKGAQ